MGTSAQLSNTSVGVRKRLEALSSQGAIWRWHGEEKVVPGEGSFWYKKEIFTVRTLNHWNNIPRYVGVSPLLEVFKT